MRDYDRDYVLELFYESLQRLNDAADEVESVIPSHVQDGKKRAEEHSNAPWGALVRSYQGADEEGVLACGTLAIRAALEEAMTALKYCEGQLERQIASKRKRNGLEH